MKIQIRKEKPVAWVERRKGAVRWEQIANMKKANILA